MKKLSEHLETVRAKPAHVRKQVAFATAGVVTAVIALLWFGISISSGTYAIQNTSFADATSGTAPTTPTPTHSSSLLGAVESAFSGSTTPAHVEVVSQGTAAPAATGPALPSDPGGPTVISF